MLSNHSIEKSLKQIALRLIHATVTNVNLFNLVHMYLLGIPGSLVPRLLPYRTVGEEPGYEANTRLFFIPTKSWEQGLV